jgi:hypothetical protein
MNEISFFDGEVSVLEDDNYNEKNNFFIETKDIKNFRIN